MTSTVPSSAIVWLLLSGAIATPPCRSYPPRRGGVPAHRGGRSRTAGTARARRRPLQVARRAPGTSAAERRSGPRRGRPRAAPAGASTPRAGSARRLRPAPPPSAHAPGADRGCPAAGALPARRTWLPPCRPNISGWLCACQGIQPLAAELLEERRREPREYDG